jgi:hypothetical protein
MSKRDMVTVTLQACRARGQSSAQIPLLWPHSQLASGVRHVTCCVISVTLAGPPRACWTGRRPVISCNTTAVAVRQPACFCYVTCYIHMLFLLHLQARRMRAGLADSQS